METQGPGSPVEARSSGAGIPPLRQEIPNWLYFSKGTKRNNGAVKPSGSSQHCRPRWTDRGSPALPPLLSLPLCWLSVGNPLGLALLSMGQ